MAGARRQAPSAAGDAPQAQPTIVAGGAFISNVPEALTSHLNATYLPSDADADGYGSAPRAEIVGAVEGRAGRDSWLREHPVRWTWATDYPPSEIPAGEEIVTTARDVARELGLEGRLEGIDTTYDGALLTRLAGVPSPAFGPGDLGRAHAPDEWVGIEELRQGARAYTRALTRWCGVA